jgi:uncharacterized glyoxalase superfamily protein PhnB
MAIEARLNVIGIVVADMAKALAFYRLLGVSVPDGSDGEPHVEAPLGGAAKLAFDTEATIESFHPGGVAPAGGGRISLAFEVGSPAEVDSLFATLTGAGAHSELEPFDAFWGQRYATVRDPDGNGVDLYAPLTS